jgi:1-pyrroline-5-carboxylate dehydrogenase
MAFRVTYSVLNADLTQLHEAFDKTLAQVKKNLGQEHASIVGGKELRSGDLLDDFNPANTEELLARFHVAPLTELDHAVKISRAAQVRWGHTPWKERAALLRKAADIISSRNLEIAAIMALETGKNRLESLGDVEESADLFRYYAQQLEEANGFERPLGSLSPNEKTKDVLRPYGVFVVISPFNFPMALASGMSAGALLGGNSVILKPSQETPWSAQKLYECLRDAGLPEGVFQLLHGRGADLGMALVKHPEVDGVAFTGSKKVGMEIWRSFSPNWIKPCYLELGGKNPTVVCAKADLDKAIEGCARSAFGLSGQKCSALSRVYVHESVKSKFVEGLIAKMKTLKMGDPLDKNVFLGPVINAAALERFYKVVDEARSEGKILAGGEDLRNSPEYKKGYFAQPTLVEIKHGHRLMREEVFAPFLTLDTFKTLDEAITRANESDYGLTAGVYSEDTQDVETFMDRAEAGILYSNRKTGATTGAWPGVQSFCGWKGSGGSGKGGCGPYYVSQFMREQSQTRML